MCWEILSGQGAYVSKTESTELLSKPWLGGGGGHTYCGIHRKTALEMPTRACHVNVLTDQPVLLQEQTQNSYLGEAVM